MQNIEIIMPLEATIPEVDQQANVVEKALQQNHSKIIELAQILLNKDITMINIIGSGDSMFLGQCVKEAFKLHSQLPLAFTQAYEYALYGEAGVGEKTALFVVSSSGRASTTRDALTHALQTPAYVVGVTDKDSQDNPFFTEPEFVLVPGAIKNGWPTQTTTAAMAILLDLSIELGRGNGTLSEVEANQLHDQLFELPAQMQKITNQLSDQICHIAAKFVHSKAVYFIGSGPGYGVANIGGAVMAEGPQKIGVPLYVEEFHHSLRVNTLDMGMPLFLIAPKDPAYERYLDTVKAVKDWGGYLITIGNDHDQQLAQLSNQFIPVPEVPYQMSALLTVIPLHLFSIELTKHLIDTGYKRPWINNKVK